MNDKSSMTKADRAAPCGGGRRWGLGIGPCFVILAWSFVVILAGCTNVRPQTTPAEQRTLARPLVVIGGFAEPGWAATHVGRWMKSRAGDRRVLGVSPGYRATFDGAAEQVVAAVERHFPGGDADQTVPVDVIGVSMGGVTARHAAAPGGTFGKRLNIAHLYTIASPHSGAVEADVFGTLAFGTARAMRSDSPFLRRLAVREQLEDAVDYPVVAYARERDRTVGYGAALPPHLADGRGQLVLLPVPWYVVSSHNFAHKDERILRDVLRRLRGEEMTDDQTRMTNE